SRILAYCLRPFPSISVVHGVIERPTYHIDFVAASERRRRMSTPAVQRQSAAAPRVPWLLLVLLACGVLALAGGLSHRHELSLAAAALLVPALTGHPELALMSLPIVFLTAIAWVFARTLKRSREPLVTRFVRVIEGEDRVNLPGVRGYTRGVTLFWACLLGAMAMLSLALALCAVPGGWLATFGVAAPFALPGSLLAWYPEAGCWIVLLAAFAGEYAFRR